VDATYVKVRRNHRIVSVAVIVAVGVHEGIKAAVAKLMNATWQRCRVGARAIAKSGRIPLSAI
jgi:transposase-like protein